jgi:hypothetical protein
MRLGLDIHGVIDSNPESFSFLSRSVIASGGEVHIVTGGSWTEELESQIRDAGVKWTHYFSVYDYLMESGIPSIGKIQFPDGTVQEKFDSDLWDTIKGGYCRSKYIDLHIDDTEAYAKYFTTPFLLYKSSSDFEKISHTDIRKHM